MPSEAPLALGVLADTGERLAGIDEEALEFFSGQQVEPDVSMDHVDAKQRRHLGTDDDVENPNNLRETGWAILYAPGVSEQVKRELEPLIELRRKQVADDKLCVTFAGPRSFVPGDTAASWLAKDGKNIAMQDVDPRRGVPYYVMIVGSPEEIPFEFQFGLDLFWAVGRLWFPTASEYGRYARSVVEYEQASSVATRRQMAIFAPRNGQDAAMGLLTDNLAHPMMKPTGTKPAFGHDQRFRLQSFLGEAATKETLDRIWRGKINNGPPAVVFTGSHGMVFFAGDERQGNQQGAIVCQEWSGADPPKRDHYYASLDLADAADAKVHGMVHFLFDCYGAGWPRNDTFSRLNKRAAKVAEKPTLARLPQALLAHGNGGALAVLGHVDRAWSSSYHSGKTGPQIEGFRSVLNRLMSGMRIGHATDRLNQRWATLSIELAEDLLRLENGLPVDREQLKGKWVARDDARNYLIFGDPAVRLRVEDMPELPG